MSSLFRTLIFALVTPPLLIVAFSAKAFADCADVSIGIDTVKESCDTLRMPVILEDPPDNLTIIDIGIFFTNDLAIEIVRSEISLNPALPGDFELDISSGNIESISLIEFRDTTQAFSFSSDSLMLFEIVLTGEVSACTEISYSA